MRTNYHLQARGENIQHLLDKLEYFGASVNTMVQTTCSGIQDETIADIITSLSKYELLYIRLTVVVKIVNELGESKSVEICS